MEPILSGALGPGATVPRQSPERAPLMLGPHHPMAHYLARVAGIALTCNPCTLLLPAGSNRGRKQVLMVHKKTDCIWRVRAAYAAKQTGGIELALQGKEMQAKQLLSFGRNDLKTVAAKYGLLFCADTAGADTPDAQKRLAQALCASCDACSPEQRACMMVHASPYPHGPHLGTMLERLELHTCCTDDYVDALVRGPSVRVGILG